MVKKVIARLPQAWQQNLKKWHFRRQIMRDQFKSPEPEYPLLHTFVGEGEWAIDIGANVGHYTARLSSLVGATGRVFSFEPIAETFEVLAANSLLFPHRNITLLNMAVSDKAGLVGFEIPHWDTGLKNYYEAHIAASESSVLVFCCTLDSFEFRQRIGLVKIDAEGHELSILVGMRRLLERDHPVLIIEAGDRDGLVGCLSPFGYSVDHLPQSPNLLFRRQNMG
jgi:FkbM family methyltransferase